MEKTTLFFWDGDEYPVAKALAQREKLAKRRAFTRDASVFDGEREDCDRVVLLPGVHPVYAERIRTAYGDKIETEHPPPLETSVDLEPQQQSAPEIEPSTRDLDRNLYRLTNRQLRDLLTARGIDFPSDEPDRAAMLAALKAEAQKGAST